MTERIPAHLEVAAFRRLAESDGGHAMVLAKGDPDRGSILLILLERGLFSGSYERGMVADGQYRWHQTGPAPGATSAEISEFCLKRRQSDPDLWLIELDVPQAERFIVNSGVKD